MKDRIEELKSSFCAVLKDAASAEALENLRVEYLGKKGHVQELMKGLKDAADKKAAECQTGYASYAAYRTPLIVGRLPYADIHNEIVNYVKELEKELK